MPLQISGADNRWPLEISGHDKGRKGTANIRPRKRGPLQIGRPLLMSGQDKEKAAAVQAKIKKKREKRIEKERERGERDKDEGESERE